MITERQIVSLERAREIKDLRANQPPDPRVILWAEMSARGWTIRHVAGLMDGDNLRNRALLTHYLHHPTGDLQLGAITAARLDRAFGFSGDFFIELEKAWVAARKEERRKRGVAA